MVNLGKGKKNRKTLFFLDWRVFPTTTANEQRKQIFEFGKLGVSRCYCGCRPPWLGGSDDESNSSITSRFVFLFLVLLPFARSLSLSLSPIYARACVCVCVCIFKKNIICPETNKSETVNNIIRRYQCPRLCDTSTCLSLAGTTHGLLCFFFPPPQISWWISCWSRRQWELSVLEMSIWPPMSRWLLLTNSVWYWTISGFFWWTLFPLPCARVLGHMMIHDDGGWWCA